MSSEERGESSTKLRPPVPQLREVKIGERALFRLLLPGFSSPNCFAVFCSLTSSELAVDLCAGEGWGCCRCPATFAASTAICHRRRTRRRQCTANADSTATRAAALCVIIAAAVPTTRDFRIFDFLSRSGLTLLGYGGPWGLGLSVGLGKAPLNLHV